MKKTIANFTAGPGVLPEEVEAGLRGATFDFMGTGVPVWSTSHRHSKVEGIVEGSIELIRKILNVPKGYSIVFMPGGGSSQFTAWLLNMLPDLDGRKPEVGYVNLGYWSQKAMQAGINLGKGKFCEAGSISSDHRIGDRYRRTAPLEFLLAGAADLDFVHITPNETAEGTQLSLEGIPENRRYTLIADMSSEILSRRFDVSQFGYIYAGAQKNLGCAGVTLVIARDGLFGPGDPHLPSPLCIAEQKKNKGGLHNTADILALYSVYLTLQWIDKEGGIPEMERRSRERASLLYGALDKSDVFESVVHKDSRSLMNATYRLKDQSRHGDLLRFYEDNGIVGIKGHKGAEKHYGVHCRATIYNAQPIKNVRLLVEVSSEFERLS